MRYAGDVTPEQAWSALRDDPAAVLVDVRTRAEWSYVGLPDLAGIGKDVVLVEWQTYPAGAVNERFTDELASAGVDRDAPVYLLWASALVLFVVADVLAFGFTIRTIALKNMRNLEMS